LVQAAQYAKEAARLEPNPGLEVAQVSTPLRVPNSARGFLADDPQRSAHRLTAI
jgi:hypothetical protein